MRRFNVIMESPNPPGANQLWVDRGKLKYFTQGHWASVLGSDRAPAPEISDNDTWIIDGFDTGKPTRGTTGGFGEPTANVVTIEPEEDAQIEISSSGPDSAKIFDFLFKIPRGKDGKDGSSIYKSLLSSKEMLAAPSWEDINGKKLSELEGKTISEILDMILFTTLYPEFVGPSATIRCSMGSSGSKYEVGTSAPSENQFNYTFSKGSITITYPDGTRDTSQGGRSGDVTGVNYTADNSDNFPVNVSWGQHTYKVIVSYAQGPQPKDSKGNNYNTPLPAGSVSASWTLYGGYYYYAGIGALNQSTMKKSILSSDSSSNSLDIQFNAETKTDRWTWWIPNQKRAIKIEYYDTGNNTFVDDKMSTNWQVTTTSIGGVSYSKITNNNPTTRGQMRLRLTLTNA